ncbi:UbiX family flavin prenyltransferase [Thermoproteus tenax]|uniref:Flavin prenyltransferase UbiX n=1 Tax=Thermoproteus tenax (strain ATCC 35583 / DSM 2078 / JCM 9277 / NBRC 100435 / Kra 1) TaxID=768679 RepID=G4RJE7_THETK|nr:UbiX family flavin prenyltransferase [Thermoproteus tenax]CCC81692.1 phenylacrylic acid decarboxylase [Thermoproteus tenax Kra 1]
MRTFVGITGASGVIYGVRLLQALKRHGVEVHLSVSRTAWDIIRHELGVERDYVLSLADYYWEEHDMGAPPASGSFPLDAVVIAPCSTKTLAAIANGLTLNLIIRAAEVALKERRKLVLLIREMPLSLVHIKNMQLAAEAGAVIMPASPPFYHRPKTIDDLIDFVVGRILDIIGVRHNDIYRWGVERLARK